MRYYDEINEMKGNSEAYDAKDNEFCEWAQQQLDYCGDMGYDVKPIQLKLRKMI